MGIANLRGDYHRRIGEEVLRFKKDGASEYPNLADKASRASREIALGIVTRIGCPICYEFISGQTAGNLFEVITKDFLENAFDLLQHLRPGQWHYSIETPISDFEQYEHLAELENIVEQMATLASSLGTDYIIKPDIVIGRWPVSDEEIDREKRVINENNSLARLTPLRMTNSEENPRLILHASISCKWTLRSDRSQNARAEALNLIRNRKGHLPHVVAVTAEPLPTRIASLALGTGDLDCVYHFALPELTEAIREMNNEDQMEMLQTLVQGRRLRDISDLPFDLAI
ncbi:MAG TPA: restriction endonuclease [Chloroflexi bacterium]|nr:restriction endonuclease [Chloroflexota bacterium]